MSTTYTKQVPCNSCPKNRGFLEPDPTHRIPSSLAIPNCQAPAGFECSNRQIYHKDVQPTPSKRQHLPLNKLGIRLNTHDYTAVHNNTTGCQSTGYLGCNPLLVSAPRGNTLLLDKPNYTGEVCVGDVEHDEIYTPYYARYGKGYTDIPSINAGQIQYYVGSLPNAYEKPNFVTPASVTHEVIKDPMGVYRPQYNRHSLQSYSWNKCNQDECDSYTHDTLEFRQELMEKQMRKRNEQAWNARWSKS